MSETEGEFFSWGILIGPALAILTLCLAFWDFSPIISDLSLLAFLGIPLSWRWKDRGAVIACCFIMLSILYSYFLKEVSMDQLSLAAALGLSFVITSRSRTDIDNLLDYLNVNFKESLEHADLLETEVDTLEEKSKRELAGLNVKLEQLSAELQVKEKNYRQHLKESERVKQQLTNANRRIDEQSSTLQVVKESLAKREVELKQKKLEIEEKDKEIELKLKELTQTCASLKEQSENYLLETKLQKQQIIEQNQRLQSLASYEALHRQLREQFDAKNQVLTQTRQELFRVNERVAFLEKEKEESTLFSYDEYQNLLIKELLKQDRYLSRLEKAHLEECESLNSIISQLMST